MHTHTHGDMYGGPGGCAMQRCLRVHVDVMVTYASLVPRPHPLAGSDGLVNEVEFLGLEAYYGMYNHCIIH